MAIVRGNAHLLMEEHRRRPFSGSVLELGRALVFLTETEARDIFRRHDVEPVSPAETLPSHDPRLAELECIDDHTFFRMLGFSDVASVDISDYEGSEYIADLDQPFPSELHNRFDVVFDAGTLQHVFDIPEAMANMHRAVRVGGRVIIGMAASHNHVDHGFYMFSPTMFYDYFAANNYEIEAARVCEFTHTWLGHRLYTSHWRVYDYTPGCLDDLSYGGFGHRQVGLFFVATRTPESTCDVVPQQSYFRRVWDDPARTLQHTESSDQGPVARATSHLEQSLARLAEHNSPMLAVLLFFKHLARAFHRRGRHLPPLVGRY
jgi:SAM-dependent methyltransferase